MLLVHHDDDDDEEDWGEAGPRPSRRSPPLAASPQRGCRPRRQTIIVTVSECA